MQAATHLAGHAIVSKSVLFRTACRRGKCGASKGDMLNGEGERDVKIILINIYQHESSRRCAQWVGAGEGATDQRPPKIGWLMRHTGGVEER